MAEYISLQKCKNPNEACKRAKTFSKQNHNQYITLGVVFDHVTLTISERLHIFAPSDTPHWAKGYWFNGKFKKFTKKQIIADQNATPALS